ncbi:YggU family protein [Candidatus Desantisbacteria bacterium CG2_30_40_21]|uniref:UPF0235 protein COZ71_02650 n=5 Tax=unclassified Candidatus Desantisiibacteriota TaxID=3106372 RepID=A0A2M7JDT0_9BACT|nr:MAG: YggU family protein [Candidatus Desantisbacteria bacterium CG2_30_40_21]PIP39989.1 MAG: YggU family protein [Candidatus Desantisbacteria bacterium CG23_combo_of_CG06-09_8_20_14_all_40_23]PIX17565.1 MAG: YggU family protein [Candidatus Desantisbacteria bacterium CG_4_8_14_3_um_filter_40_12]PIY20363.1 MAG: YggU family protein [Candidatus Desantisbacteria bacterium CG_4_10_14_3_um_filter_40_18]PJB28628.1 MAG: YggU family protein [Candidatus Desantisbacteria bacterium CG_4_9_14_3_um_filter_
MKTLYLNIKLQPSASKNEIVGQEGQFIRVRVQSPPVDGKANKALINLLAKELGVKKAQVSIISGQTSRMKRVQVQVEDGA